MPGAYPELKGYVILLCIDQAAVDNEFQGTLNGGTATIPGRRQRRRLGPASQARAVSGLFRRMGIREELDIFLIRLRGTDGAAVYAGRLDANKEFAIESVIAGYDSIIVYIGLRTHRHFHNTGSRS